jgi:hypothetical protein
MIGVHFTVTVCPRRVTLELYSLHFLPSSRSIVDVDLTDSFTEVVHLQDLAQLVAPKVRVARAITRKIVFFILIIIINDSLKI